MTIDRVNEIKEQLEEGKEERTRAKVKMEDIETNWKEEYAVKSLKGAKTLKEEYTSQIEKLQDKEEKLEKEIEELLDTMEEEDD